HPQTIDVPVDEPGQFPPPVKQSELGARLAALERWQQSTRKQRVSAVAVDAEMEVDSSDEEEAPRPVVVTTPALPAAAAAGPAEAPSVPAAPVTTVTEA